MGIADKIANAKKSDWLVDGLSSVEVKTIVELAKISACIERRRIELGMTQQEFARYMGVSQGMISKWESREYNFTIRTLNEICDKLNIDFSVNLEHSSVKADYAIVKWDRDKTIENGKSNKWIRLLSNGEAIA